MVRSLIVLAAVPIVAISGCRGTTEVSQDRVTQAADVSEAGEAPVLQTEASSHEAGPTTKERVAITIDFAEAGERPPQTGPQTEPGGGRGGRRGGGSGIGSGSGHGSNCPQTQVGTLLGVRISQPHGCVVGSIRSGSRAAKAGIKSGDSIVECSGVAVSCPRELLPRLQAGMEKGKVDLVISRTKASTEAAAAEEPSAPRSTAGEGGETPESPSPSQGAEEPKSE